MIWDSRWLQQFLTSFMSIWILTNFNNWRSPTFWLFTPLSSLIINNLCRSLRREATSTRGRGIAFRQSSPWPPKAAIATWIEKWFWPTFRCVSNVSTTCLMRYFAVFMWNFFWQLSPRQHTSWRVVNSSPKLSPCFLLLATEANTTVALWG